MKKANTKPDKKPTKPPAFISIAPDYYSRIEHYKSEQNPRSNTRWIKLHLELLEDFAFCSLPDETKFHFVGLMMLAARNFNRLPTDSNFLRQKLSATSEINLEKLLKIRLIIAVKRKKTNGNSDSIEQQNKNREQEQEQEVRQQTTEKPKNVVVVPPSKSVFSSPEIGDYEASCRDIKKPPAFRKHLESGAADKDIADFLERRANAENGKVLEEKAKRNVFDRCGARPKRS
jgi:hypothetical protein